jgi:membrane protein DedA with SNARE-associated domain
MRFCCSKVSSAGGLRRLECTCWHKYNGRENILSNWNLFFQTFFQALRSGQLPQLGSWTYMLLAALVAVEGPLATLLGAAAASAGLMKPGWVFVAAASGNLTADTLWYTLGYLGKIDWMLRFGKKLGIQQDVLERLENGMREHATRILFVGKLTLSMMIPALLAAGLVKAPWKRWFPAIFAGEMLWTGVLMVIGFYATEAIKRVERGVEYAAIGGAVIFVLFMILIVRRVIRQQFQDDVKPMNPGNKN